MHTTAPHVHACEAIDVCAVLQGLKVPILLHCRD